jgi:Spy/CpxP family protein refolding chaperone
MTTHRLRLAAGLIFAGTCMSAVPALAQQGGPPPAGDRRGPPAMDARRGPPSIDERVKRMTEDLGLSAEQATRVKAVLTSERQKADSILAQRARQQDAERDAMMAVHSSTEKALASILTPEQRTRHDAMRARGGPGGRGPGGHDDRGPGRRGDDRRPGPDRDEH